MPRSRPAAAARSSHVHGPDSAQPKPLVFAGSSQAASAHRQVADDGDLQQRDVQVVLKVAEKVAAGDRQRRGREEK